MTDPGGRTPPLANLNGERMPLAQARVPVLDRGFLFGDAVYEVLRIYRGRPWLLDDHLTRLARSLAAVRIEGVDVGRVRDRLLDTVAAGPFVEATAYVQITRGVAPRKHPFPARATPTELIYVEEFVDRYREARHDGGAVITHPDHRWDRCDVKSTNLLANVLAMQAATEAGCLEALLYRPDGTVTEGSHTSCFGVRGGAVLTAPNSRAILPGVTRRLVLRLADRAGIPTWEEILRRDDLTDLSEVFLTGTTSEVLPITRVDGRPVGDGRPGPVTRRLQQAFADSVRDFLNS